MTKLGAVRTCVHIALCAAPWIASWDHSQLRYQLDLRVAVVKGKRHGGNRGMKDNRAAVSFTTVS
eukprot:3468828-Pyramimonas_sp.AAC.1